MGTGVFLLRAVWLFVAMVLLISVDAMGQSPKLAVDTPGLDISSRNTFFCGLTLSTALGDPVVNKTSFGFELAGLHKRSDRHYIGMSVTFSGSGTDDPVDIPNNLQNNESVISSLKLLSLGLANRFSLTPEDNVQVFLDANIGFRVARFTTVHEGYVLVIKTEEDIFDKTTVGVDGQVFLSFCFTVKPDHISIQFRTGMNAGTSVRCIDVNSIAYENQEFSYSEKRLGAAYWVNGLSLVFRF